MRLIKTGKPEFTKWILGAMIASPLFLLPAKGFSDSLPGPDLDGVEWTIKMSTEQTGKTPTTHTLMYSMTPNVLRIDQPGWKGFDIILWRLDLRKVYALDTVHKTYREESVGKVLAYQNFSDLIGQHAGSNPGDVKKTMASPMTVSGYTCQPEQILHKFRGIVVGMINGDQETIVCNSDSISGFEAIRKFQENMAKLSPSKTPSSPGKPVLRNSFFLYLKRTTHYQAGFIVKLLNTVGLYDLSKIPTMQKEEARVTEIKETSFSPDFFNVPAGYKKIEIKKS